MINFLIGWTVGSLSTAFALMFFIGAKGDDRGHVRIIAASATRLKAIRDCVAQVRGTGHASM